MSDIHDEAAVYLQELQELRKLYLAEAQEEIQTHFKVRESEPPEEFHDSSFLYIRSYDADVGLRPFSGIAHWRSPDVTLSPLSSLGTYTTTLNAGDTYLIRCTLRNRGDLAVPSAKVELFLTDPTIGFDTRFATNLTLGKVPTAWVGSDASAAAEFAYTVPPTEAGHKCLFARAFSFSPLELPIDDFQLDPRVDRHIAQQNLNIVGQALPFALNLIHAPNARMRMELMPLEAEELFRLRHPVLADVTPALEFPGRDWVRLTQLELAEPGSADAGVEVEPDALGLFFNDSEGFDLDTQRELTQAVWDVLAAIQEGATQMSEHRDLFAEFRAMNSQARRSRFSMVLPELGLPAGQAIGLDVTGVDDNLDPPQVVGGITLVLVGENRPDR